MKIIHSNSHCQLKKYILAAHPIIQYYINKLRLREIFQSYIEQDKRLTIPIEDGLCLLIHNILTEPLALYKINEWIEPLDMNSLGLNSYAPSSFNDDRFGRCLDKFANSNRKMIFFRLALRIIKIFELNCQHIHQDTTSIKLCGRYKNWLQQPKADFGHSKDHRPDLKQLVVGINMAGDGSVVIDHETYGGNRTDDTVHISNWDRLRRLLKSNEFIYTADSKLCTKNNLKHIEFYGGQYITIMPRTWKEDKTFREMVKEKDVKWHLILERENNRHPNSITDQYYSTKTNYETDCGRRLIWIKSSQKNEIDQNIRTELIEKTLTSLRELNTKLNKYKLKKLKNIKKAINNILNKNKTEDLIQFKINRHFVVKKSYLKSGRPKPDSPIKMQRKISYSLSYCINQEELIKQRRIDGIFPMLTNNRDKSDKEILQIYKNQSFLENRNSQLKTYLEVAPVFLKNAKRVLALLDIVILSLSIATLMERDLRMGMKRQEIKSIPIYPEKRECKYPTTHSIIYAFRNVEKYEFRDQNNKKVEYFPPELTTLQKQIIDLMGLSVSIYA